jgi:hypothetical protein
MKINRTAACATLLLCAVHTASFAETDTRESFDDDNYNYLGGFSLGYKYQEMEADTIRNAYVKTIGLNILQFEWFPEQATWMQETSWLTAIRPKLTYELTPDNSAEQDEIAQASKSDQEGWSRFVADISIDPFKLFGGDNSDQRIELNYDVQTFLVTVQATQDYYYIEDNNARLLTAGDKLDVNTTFTEATAGWISTENITRFGLGYFSVDYEKPISTDVASPIETIYRGTFEASGVYLKGGITIGGFDIALRYDYSFDATADFNNGTSLSTDSSGYEDSVEYTAYTLDAVYDLNKSRFKLPVELRLNYVQREFSNFTEGSKLNDDRIFSLSVIGSFTL